MWLNRVTRLLVESRLDDLGLSSCSRLRPCRYIPIVAAPCRDGSAKQAHGLAQVLRRAARAAPRRSDAPSRGRAGERRGDDIGRTSPTAAAVGRAPQSAQPARGAGRAPQTAPTRALNL
jgi:hypothetical protein